MGKYYLVRIRDSKRRQVEVIGELSHDFVRSRVIDPYEEGLPITLKGVTYQIKDIDSLEIATTDSSFDELVDIQTARSVSKRISANRHSQEVWAFTLANDVTNDFITGPPGSRRTGRDAQGFAATTSDRTRVFVIHGRDMVARQGVIILLQSVGLRPIEWSEAKAATGKGSPYVGEILEHGFEMAHAALVILTPDDEGKVKEKFAHAADPAYETSVTGQARQNVVLEAGMALGKFPDRTVLVEMGNLRPLSDLQGRHTVRLDNSAPQRLALLQALQTVGCDFSLDGKTDWATVGTIGLTPD